MCFMDHKTQSSIGDSLPNKILEGKAIKPKEKRRNNEKRKEKSRDAARCRRSRETEIFNELGETLPIRKENLDNLDKASVMRLAIATLKIENMLELFKINSGCLDKKQILGEFDEEGVMRALDGFFISLSSDGDVTYVSENIHEYIGIQQIDMIGNPVWDYIHQCDHNELREILNTRRLESLNSMNNSERLKKICRNFLVRIKCTLTSRGRNVNIKSASYKVINIVGHTVVDGDKNNIHQFIGIARLIPHPSNIEVPLDSRTFLSKHSLNMKFSYVDDKMWPILGYTPNDLLDESLYEYHHGADSEMLMSAFKNVIDKGQSETPKYRFLGRNGGFCWVVSQATLVYDKQKPQSVVCVNYVISELMNQNEIYSLHQLEAFNALSQNEKLKLKAEIGTEKKQIADFTTNYQTPPGLEADNHIETTRVTNERKQNPVLNNNSICRVFIGKQPNVEPIKGNPKAVTESVFKFKKSINHQLFGKQIESPNTTILQLMKAGRVDKKHSIGRVHSNISEPSIIPRQTVVTASLFQPRRVKAENICSNTSIELQPSEAMNKAFDCNLNNDISRNTFLKFGKDENISMVNATPTQKDINCPTANKVLSLNSSNDTSFLSLADPPLFGDIYNGIILPDNYSGLLPEEIQSIHSHTTKAKTDNNFLNFVNGSNVTSQKQTGPSIPKDSECRSSLSSLCSPNPLSQDDEFAFMSTTLDNNEIDLSMRAPYIPMDENDDLPLLTEDLMWSAFSDEISLHKEIKGNKVFQTKSIMADENDQDSSYKTRRNLFPTDNTMPVDVNTNNDEKVLSIANDKGIIRKKLDSEQAQSELLMEDDFCADALMKHNNMTRVILDTCDGSKIIAKKDIQGNEDLIPENEVNPTYSIHSDGTDDLILQWTMVESVQSGVCSTEMECRNSSPSHFLVSSNMHSENVGLENVNINQKRCSSSENGAKKRIKCGSGNPPSEICQNKGTIIMTRASDGFPDSHLLQQLMAPTPQKSEENYSRAGNIERNLKGITEWDKNVGQNLFKNQSSDSVLKNLLCNSNTNGTEMKQHMLLETTDRYTIIDSENELKTPDNDYGLVEDVFLVGGLQQIFSNSPTGEPLNESLNNNDMKELSMINEENTFQSFEKQITISVPQPPPLKAEAFTIGGGLFQGITDHTNILPMSLISPNGPMEINDCNKMDSSIVQNNLINIWTSGMN